MFRYSSAVRKMHFALLFVMKRFLKGHCEVYLPKASHVTDFQKVSKGVLPLYSSLQYFIMKNFKRIEERKGFYSE